jgi:hypothetical protein
MTSLVARLCALLLGVGLLSVAVSAPAAAGARTPPAPLAPTDVVIAPSANGVVTEGDTFTISAVYRTVNNQMVNDKGHPFEGVLSFKVYNASGAVVAQDRGQLPTFYLTRSPSRQETQSSFAPLPVGNYVVGVSALNFSGNEITYGPETRVPVTIQPRADFDQLANHPMQNSFQCTDCFGTATSAVIGSITVPPQASADFSVPVEQVVANSVPPKVLPATGIGGATEPKYADPIYVGRIHLNVRVSTLTANNTEGDLSVSYVDRPAPANPTLRYPPSLDTFITMLPVFDRSATQSDVLRLTNTGGTALKVEFRSGGWVAWYGGSEEQLTDDELEGSQYDSQDVGSTIQSGPDDARTTLPPATEATNSCGPQDVSEAFIDGRAAVPDDDPVDVQCTEVSPVESLIPDADRPRSLSEESNDSTGDQAYARGTLPIVNTASCYQKVTLSDWQTKRYAMCSARKVTHIRYRQPNCCSPYVEVGRVSYTVYRDIALGRLNTNISFSMQVVFSGCGGEMCEPSRMRLTAWCEYSCGTEKFLESTISATDRFSAVLSKDFDGSLSAAGTSHDMRIGTRVDLLNPCGSNCVRNDEPIKDDSRIIRCDNFAYFAQSAGCTVPAFEPVFSLSIQNEGVDESAQFIRDVQTNVYPWGVVGMSSAWLTRTNKATRDKNRYAACRGFSGSKSCDEYPFASTDQGCYSGGLAINCNRANVLLSDNVNAGRKLGSFYRRTRLKRDYSDEQFYVRIVG